MTNRVLDQRLNDEAGHERGSHIGVDLHLDAQVRRKVNLLDCQVAIEKTELFGQGDFLPRSGIE